MSLALSRALARVPRAGARHTRAMVMALDSRSLTLSARSPSAPLVWQQVRGLTDKAKPTTPAEEVVEGEAVENNANNNNPLDEDDNNSSKPKEEEEELLKETEVLKGESEESTFQAETAKLLEIVANSIYTDKEVFLRELISNAADALEKMRYFSVTEKGGGIDPGTLHIDIAGNEDLKTITIADTGIGMSKEELKENLGTIARSGSLAFVKQLQEGGSPDDAASSIIGRFGVGFYSVFMVGHRVRVYSRSGRTDDETGYCWESDGSGRFTIREAEGVQRGTKIVISLKPESEMFASKNFIKTIVEKYSNFVNYDISVNGKKTKRVEALWMKSAKDVSEEEHNEFYKYIAVSYDLPTYRLMYRADAPVAIRSVLYVPQMHTEKYGMGRMELGVNLYSRKVLIKHRCKELLPEWLRFLKGAVDCEDIPLNISRENMQDTTLMRKLNSVLTKRVLRWLHEESQSDPDKYAAFFKEFGHFLKEGCVVALAHKEAVSKLLRFESSATESGKLTSLDDYISRMKDKQQDIFYLCVPNRDYGLSSPYYEAFKERGIEVLFLYQTIDDFVMTNVHEYGGKKLVSAESSEVNLSNVEKKEDEVSKMDSEEASTLAEWIQTCLSENVSAVRPSTRLVSSPAVVMDHESAAMRRMMKMVEGGSSVGLGKVKLEINPNHDIMVNLNAIRYSHPDLAASVVKQVFDNALVAAGLLDDPRSMLPRLNGLLVELLRNNQQAK